MARPRTFDEAEVMRSVREQFRRAGYAATSVGDLGAATGLGKGSLYGAFGDKHTLYVRALSEYCDEVFGATAAALLDGDRPAFDRLTTCIRGLADHIAGDAERRGCLMASSAAERGSVDDDVAQRTGRALAILHSALKGCIAEAQRDGSLGSAVDPAGLASLVLAVLRGMEALGKANAAPEVVLQAADQVIALLRDTGGSGATPTAVRGAEEES